MGLFGLQKEWPFSGVPGRCGGWRVLSRSQVPSAFTHKPRIFHYQTSTSRDLCQGPHCHPATHSTQLLSGPSILWVGAPSGVCLSGKGVRSTHVCYMQRRNSRPRVWISFPPNRVTCKEEGISGGQETRPCSSSLGCTHHPSLGRGRAGLAARGLAGSNAGCGSWLSGRVVRASVHDLCGPQASPSGC